MVNTQFQRTKTHTAYTVNIYQAILPFSHIKFTQLTHTTPVVNKYNFRS